MWLTSCIWCSRDPRNDVMWLTSCIWCSRDPRNDVMWLPVVFDVVEIPWVMLCDYLLYLMLSKSHEWCYVTTCCIWCSRNRMSDVMRLTCCIWCSRNPMSDVMWLTCCIWTSHQLTCTWTDGTKAVICRSYLYTHLMFFTFNTLFF